MITTDRAWWGMWSLFPWICETFSPYQIWGSICLVFDIGIFNVMYRHKQHERKLLNNVISDHLSLSFSVCEERVLVTRCWNRERAENVDDVIDWTSDTRDMSMKQLLNTDSTVAVLPYESTLYSIYTGRGRERERERERELETVHECMRGLLQ